MDRSPPSRASTISSSSRIPARRWARSSRAARAGTLGAAGSISFYPSKTLGAFGDGGAIITDDDMLADKLRILRDHGRGHGGNIHDVGVQLASGQCAGGDPAREAEAL